MKFMDKVKNFFTEEVEEEVKPIKKEVIQVEIPSPEANEQKRVTLSSVKTEVEEPIKEEKKSAPVYFDDKDFEDLERKPEKKKPTYSRTETYRSSFRKEEPKIEGYNGKDRKDEKKVFKPSPIISPVYGVLDKNYSKDDIVSKGETRTVKYTKTSEVTIEEVRNKAYGTLEDDLESNLFNDFATEKNNDDLLDDLKDETVVLDVENKDLDDFINEGNNKDEYYADDEVEAITQSKEEYEEDNLVEDELNKLTDSDEPLDSNDLFNLIDSMYEKKEDE